MSLFRVEVTYEQSGTYYIEAPDFATAQKDANELGVPHDVLDEHEDSVFVDPRPWSEKRGIRVEARGEPLWTGGPDGVWDVVT